MRRSARSFARLAFCLALVLFAGCAPGNGPLSPTPTPAEGPTADESAVTITFACLDWQVPTFESLAADFHEQTPSVKVEVLAVDDIIADDYYNVPRLVSAVDTAYYLVYEPNIMQGALRDLTPFIQADPAFATEDFFPGMLDAFRWNNTTLALPSQADLTFIFYDEQKFDAAGVPYPALDWTQDEFLVAAQQLTLRRDDEVTQYGFVDYDGASEGVLVVRAAGPALGRQLPLDAPAVVDAVRWYTDLALRYGVMPRSPKTEQSWTRDLYLISMGKAAMWTQGYSPDALADPDRPAGIAPFPTDDGAAVPAGMYGYMISAGTQRPQESWLWLRFLTYQRLPRLGVDELPARRSVAEQTGYWTRFDAETLPVIQFAAEHLYFQSLLSGMLSSVSVAVLAVFDGEQAEAALADAQAAFTEAMAAQVTPAPFVVATPRPYTGLTVAFAPPLSGNFDYGLAASFNQAHPGVQVRIIPLDQIQNADCFADSTFIVTEGGQARPMNLQPILEADAAFSLDDFYPSFLQASRYQGDLWSLPLQARARVMFYNRALFDAAGLPYPQPGWTLDEFLADAVALTAGSGEDKAYGFMPRTGEVGNLSILLAMHGAQLWDEQGQPRFDAPDVVAALRWYSDLILTYTVTPAFPEGLPQYNPSVDETRQEMVFLGQVAMWLDFAGIDPGDARPMDAGVGMVPLPLRAAGEQGVTELYYDGLFIAADTPRSQECWEWFKFLSAQSTAVRGVPARRSALESDEFAALIGEDTVATYRALLDYANVPMYPNLTAAGDLQWLYQALADVLNGASPEAALAEAQRQAEE